MTQSISTARQFPVFVATLFLLLAPFSASAETEDKFADEKLQGWIDQMQYQIVVMKDYESARKLSDKAVKRAGKLFGEDTPEAGYVSAYQALAVANEATMWRKLPQAQVLEIIESVRTFNTDYADQMSTFMVSIITFMADLTEARVWMQSDKTRARELYDKAHTSLEDISGGEHYRMPVEMERMFAEDL